MKLRITLSSISQTATLHQQFSQLTQAIAKCKSLQPLQDSTLTTLSMMAPTRSSLSLRLLRASTCRESLIHLPRQETSLKELSRLITTSTSTTRFSPSTIQIQPMTRTKSSFGQLKTLVLTLLTSEFDHLACQSQTTQSTIQLL